MHGQTEKHTHYLNYSMLVYNSSGLPHIYLLYISIERHYYPSAIKNFFFKFKSFSLLVPSTQLLYWLFISQVEKGGEGDYQEILTILEVCQCIHNKSICFHFKGKH